MPAAMHRGYVKSRLSIYRAQSWSMERIMSAKSSAWREHIASLRVR